VTRRARGAAAQRGAAAGIGLELELDEQFMRRALLAAAGALGRTRPNPAVGAVVVRDGRVIAEGATEPAGGAHAEIVALREAGERARGATVYVTLEPCNHVGRTGPCTEALLAAGVARVVCGMRDPNPGVRGGGVARLRRARGRGRGAVDVDVGVCESECRAFLADWITWVTTGRPRVTLKAAVTLDGRLAARGGDASWVSSELSRAHARSLRARAHAILVGARTVARDRPRLTTRIRGAPDPLRVVLDGALSIPPAWPGLRGALVATTRTAPEARARRLRARGADVVRLPGARVELGALLDELGRREVQSLLVEGGGDVHAQFVARGLADELQLYIAPKLIGAGGVPLLAAPGPARMADAWHVEAVTAVERGGDVWFHGYFPARRP
jgi:diaminohydroxyphosphoribosylaminopyrimidine deaminase / 5-amino-6-(5-phosphoribosylamino)uracil reductase